MILLRSLKRFSRLLACSYSELHILEEGAVSLLRAWITLRFVEKFGPIYRFLTAISPGCKSANARAEFGFHHILNSPYMDQFESILSLPIMQGDKIR